MAFEGKDVHYLSPDRATKLVYDRGTRDLRLYVEDVYVGTFKGGGNPAGVVTTPATTSVEEYGNGVRHFTRLTLTNFAVGTSGDNENLAIGAKFYTLPAGDIIIDHATMIGTILANISDKDEANSEVGIGTVIGSGANATLGDVNAAAENVCGPVVISAYNNTAVVGVAVAGPAQPFLRIAASGGLARDLFLNTATAWDNITAPGAVTFTGVITLDWRKLD